MASVGATTSGDIFFNSSPDNHSRLFNSLFAIVLAYSLLVAVVVYVFAGEPAIGFVMVGGTVVVALSFLRPVYSLYILVFLGFVCEQFPTIDGWTASLRYHSNLSNVSLRLTGIPITPMEIHLLLIVSGLLVRVVIHGAKKIHVIALKPMLIYAAVIIAGVVYGLVKGGEFLPALWEVRAIFYLFFLALIVPRLVSNPQQIKVIIWLMVIGLSLRAVEVIHSYANTGWALGGLDAFGNPIDGFGNHEDAGFWATILAFTVGLSILKISSKLRTFLFVFAVPFFVAVIASGRRTFYAVIGNCIIVIFLLLDKSIQKRILQTGWKIGLVFVFYLAIFWNSNSDFAGPAHSIKMSFGEDMEEAGGRYLSNMYRKVEDHNLATSYRSQTLVGSGYGTKLTFYMPLPLSWDMGFYSPHNQILGVFVKTGFVGFVFFLFFYLTTISEISGAFGDEKDVYRKAVLTFAIATIMNHLVYSFFDIMLTGYRNNLQVGVMLGLASSIITMQQQSIPPVVKDTPSPVSNPIHRLLGAGKKEERSRPVYS